VRPYRRPYAERGPTRGLVTVQSYGDLLEAELARTRLGSEDIDAVVIEPTGFNPLLTAAAGGVLLQVDESDRVRAEEVLAQPLPEADEIVDEEDEGGSVRCPRCELTYCSYTRMLPTSSYPHPLIALGLLAPKRWRCSRCEHVWNDAEEGPRTLTRLLPGDPRPIFRLGRAHPGMGLFVGGIAGLFGALMIGGAIGPAGGLIWPLATVLGWLVGRSFRADFCSAPQCRAVLPPGAEACPRCKGAVAGAIKRAAQHYSAAADFRRELAALRASDAKKRSKHRKKKSSAERAPAG
jgi:hypothetical protein